MVDDLATTKDGKRKLSVFGTAWRAYRYFFRHFFSLVKLAWVPLLVHAALQTAFYLAARQGGLWTFLDSVIGEMLWVVFPAIILAKWHRFMLLGPFPVGMLGAFNVKRPEMVFLAVTAALYSVTVLAPFYVAVGVETPFVLLFIHLTQFIPRDFHFSFTFFIVVIAFIYVFCRFFILLPAAAIGDRVSIAGTWQLTRANTSRIFAIIGLTVGIPTMLSFPLLFAWLTILTPKSGPLAGMQTVEILQMLYELLMVIIIGGLGATALSFCYRHLVGLESASVGCEEAKT